MHTKDPSTQAYIAGTLGTKWLFDFSATANAPAGTSKLYYWKSLTPPTAALIAAVPAGSVWYPFGEANRTYTPTQLVAPYHDFYAAIKAADPTAKVTGPSMLNWGFTCEGCGGYTSGQTWMNSFRNEYRTTYSVSELPFDIWAIDVYPIDWVTLPTTNAQRAIDQIAGMRSYMDAVGINKPIWVTELGLHWGYSEMEIRSGETYPWWPKGTYREDLVVSYFNTLYTWLEGNSTSLKIEKWFTFQTYANLNIGNEGGYNGMTMFDGPSIGAGLTPVGLNYKNWVAN